MNDRVKEAQRSLEEAERAQGETNTPETRAALQRAQRELLEAQREAAGGGGARPAAGAPGGPPPRDDGEAR